MCYRVSTIRLVMQDFATIRSRIHHPFAGLQGYAMINRKAKRWNQSATFSVVTVLCLTCSTASKAGHIPPFRQSMMDPERHKPTMLCHSIQMVDHPWPSQRFRSCQPNDHYKHHTNHICIYTHTYIYLYIYILMRIIYTYTHHFCSWHVWTTVDERNPGPVGTVDGFIPWEFLYLYRVL